MCCCVPPSERNVVLHELGLFVLAVGFQFEASEARLATLLLLGVQHFCCWACVRCLAAELLSKCEGLSCNFKPGIALQAEREQQRALAAAKQSAKDAQAPPKPAPKPAAKPAAAAKPTPEAQVKTAPKDAKKPVPSAQKAKPQAVAAGAKPAKVAPTAEADGSSQGGAAQARAWINDWRASQTGARAAVPYDTPANVAQTGAYSDLFGA